MRRHSVRQFIFAVCEGKQWTKFLGSCYLNSVYFHSVHTIRTYLVTWPVSHNITKVRSCKFPHWLQRAPSSVTFSYYTERGTLPLIIILISSLSECILACSWHVSNNSYYPPLFILYFCITHPLSVVKNTFRKIRFLVLSLFW